MTTSRSRRWCPKKPVTCRNGTISKQRPRACSLPPRSVVAGNIFTADYSPPVRDRSFRCLSIRRIRDLSRLLVTSSVYILCRLHKPPSPKYHTTTVEYKIIIYIGTQWTWAAQLCVLYAYTISIVRRVYNI